MSKRDDDSADMEVGMTTAERRRRRRRGGGLRVPSDNVPRRTNPPVVAPVPEDPSLAMSIAYSFSSEAAAAADALPRTTIETPVPSFADAPPEAMPTVIDPPSDASDANDGAANGAMAPADTVDHDDFEMKTREMTAVDLESLGLAEHAPASTRATTAPSLVATPVDATPSSTVEVNFATPAPVNHGRAETPPLSLDDDGVEVGIDDDDDAPSAAAITQQPPRRERMKTMALSEEDLEEVRESLRAQTAELSQPAATPAPAVRPTEPTKPAEPAKPAAVAPPPRPSNAVQAVPVVIPSAIGDDEPMSVPEIDINELAERADSSGEFEVDVDDDDDKKPAVAPVAAGTPPPIDPKRARPASVPPPVAPTAATSNPGTPAQGHAAPPPPPPPVAHKTPPAPPPKPKAATDKPAMPAAATAKSDPKLEARIEPKKQKAWFVDLFDEDYLRTLPFLTPQATQAEAEFVSSAMGLTPGAQVLDVGCGYGRHAMELAARGVHVVGLDISTPLLVRGGEEAHRRGLQINFIRGDMRELDFDAQFDAAYCLFSTFGYFDDETNKKTIVNIARALKPGGRFLVEILNRDYVIADLPTRVWWEGEGCVVLEEVELNYFSSRIQVNRSVVFDDGRQLEQEISVRAYSLHEIGKLMHAAGFRVLEVSGGYHTRGRFFGNQSRHIIVLAERKDAPV